MANKVRCYEKVVNTLEITKEQWLMERKKGIGGSDIGALMGVNTYSSPFMVFIDKTTDYNKDLSENEAVYWGTTLEEIVAKEFEKRTGKKVRRLNAMLKSTEIPYALADVDRMIVGEDAGLECKTTNAFNTSEWKDDEIPASYICQCQWYMYVTGCPKWYIACLIGGQRFVWKEVQRDDEIIKYMVEVATTFWENNVLKGDAPAIDGSDNCTEYIKEHYPEDNGCEVRFTSDISALVENLYQVKRQKKELCTQELDLENRIKQYLGEAQCGINENYKVVWKTQRGKPKFDLDKLVKDYNVTNLSKYYEETTIRKFSVKENKGE